MSLRTMFSPAHCRMTARFRRKGEIFSRGSARLY
jgi:hypothetical protein